MRPYAILALPLMAILLYLWSIPTTHSFYQAGRSFLNRITWRNPTILHRFSQIIRLLYGRIVMSSDFFHKNKITFHARRPQKVV